MKIVVLDTETTGLDPKVHTAIEVAAVLYCTAHNAPIATFSTLIEADENPVEHINRIPVTLLQGAMSADEAWGRVEGLVVEAECIVAHNAPFDRNFTPKEVAKLKPWICSMTDLAYPEPYTSKSLTSICLAHGIAIIGAHRALTDVDMLVRLFQQLSKRGIDVGEMLETALKSQVPKALIQALVSYDDKQKAKDAGFIWKPPPLKRWEKRMTLEEAKKLPFRTKVIEAAT
jgi:DNA polymerase-3 subunit epsilon